MKHRPNLVFQVVAVALMIAFVLAAVTQLHLGSNPITSSSSSNGTSTSEGSSSPQYLSLSASIPLPPTHGRIDHMSVDLERGLLFVACYANNTVAVIDVNSGHFLRSISGLDNPQGVVWVPAAGKLFVSNAGDGSLEVFNGSSFSLVGTLSLGEDADNMRYDGASGLLYVGFGSGGIAAIDPTSDEIVSTESLPAHPEAFEVEAAGTAVFVNVPSANLITAFDKSTGSSILNRTMTGSNFPMALDESGGRLIIATRDPSELRILDVSSPSLRSVANVTLPGDPDDIFLDSRGTIYVSCGQGSVEVVERDDQGRYTVAQAVQTGQGARTSLLVPELGSLFVAAPAGATASAEILVYSLATSGLGAWSSASSTTTTVNLNGSKPGTGDVRLRLIPSHPIVPVGGEMSFFLVLNDMLRPSDNLSISASAPPGLTVAVSSSMVTTIASVASVGIDVSSSADLVPGTYEVVFHTISSTGASDHPVEFDLQEHVVQITPDFGQPLHVNLTVTAGSTVTWYSLDQGQDEVYRLHTVVFQSIGVSSGIIDTFEVWSHEFDTPGIYQYVDTQEPAITGEVRVVPSPVAGSPSLSLSPGSGPTGFFATLDGGGYAPGATYEVCVGTSGSESCGVDYVSVGYPASLGSFAFLGTFTADSAGDIPPGTRVAVPDLFAGPYEIGVTPLAGGSMVTAAAFTVVAPRLSLGTTSLAPNTSVTVSGSGYAPSTAYTVCLVLVGTQDCGYQGDREEVLPGYQLGTFVTDANGDVPAGAQVSIPAFSSTQPRQEVIGVFLPGAGFIMIVTLPVTLVG